MSKVTLYKTLKPCLNFQVPGHPDEIVSFISKRFATDKAHVEEAVKAVMNDPAFLIYVDPDEPEVEFEEFISPRQRHQAMTQAYYSEGTNLQPAETLVGVPASVVHATSASSVDVKGTRAGAQVPVTAKVSTNEAAAALKQQLAAAAAASTTPPATENKGS